MRYYHFLLFVAVCNASPAMEIHVSPVGSDDQPGTSAAPVQTLEKARVLAQSLGRGHPAGAVNILLHPGIHTIRKTVVFRSEDSGTAEAPLNIVAWHDPAAPDARPILVGGAVVTGWKKSTFNGRSDVFEAELKPLALAARFRQVYLNGKRLTWARYPNEDKTHPYSGGWAYVDGVRPPMYQDIEGERTDTVVLRAKDARPWSRPQDGEVCIFPRYNWWNRIEKIAAYDPQTRTITLASRMQYAARPEDRFCVMGMREELDAPGEWFQDVESQKLYLIPPAGADLAKDVVTVPTVNDIMHFDRTHHVRIRGLELTCAGQHAIRFSGCDYALVEKCSIHDLSYFEGSANNHGRFFAFAWGIYLDESGCGNDVYGNIVERCQVGAMHLHNARENHIDNNIFVNNAGPQGKTHQLSLQTWDNSPSSDEGEFWEKRDVKALVAEVGEWNEAIAAITGELKDLLGPRVESQITDYPDFEHLEAKGQERRKRGKKKPKE